MPCIAKTVTFTLIFFWLIHSVAATPPCHENKDCSACVREKHCTFVVTHDEEQVCAGEDELDMLEVKMAIHRVAECRKMKASVPVPTSNVEVKSVEEVRTEMEKEKKSAEHDDTESALQEGQQKTHVVAETFHEMSHNPSKVDSQNDTSQLVFIHSSNESVQAGVVVKNEAKQAFHHTADPVTSADTYLSSNKLPMITDYANRTCPSSWKETKVERMNRSLCRSFKLVKSFYRKTNDWMIHWNMLSPVSKNPEMCKYLEWQRNNCK